MSCFRLWFLRCRGSDTSSAAYGNPNKQRQERLFCASADALISLMLVTKADVQTCGTECILEISRMSIRMSRTSQARPAMAVKCADTEDVISLTPTTLTTPTTPRSISAEQVESLDAQEPVRVTPVTWVVPSRRRLVVWWFFTILAWTNVPIQEGLPMSLEDMTI